jgi:hypothetical protein
MDSWRLTQSSVLVAWVSGCQNVVFLVLKVLWVKWLRIQTIGKT